MKKLFVFMLVIVLAISGIVACTEESEYKELKKGSKGEDVRALQERLIELGYLNDKADGSYGNKTKEAVELFQFACDYRVITGIADSITQEEIFDSDTKMYNPDRDELFKIEYDAMMRNPDDYSYGGFHYTDASYVKEYKFSGKVIQLISEDVLDKYGYEIAARIATSGNSKNVVYVQIHKDCIADQRILEGDSLTLYGFFNGVDSFTTVLGANTVLPSFSISAIQFN